MHARLHLLAALLALLLLALVPFHARAQLTYAGTLSGTGYTLTLHFDGDVVSHVGTAVVLGEHHRCERAFRGRLGGDPPSALAVFDCPGPGGATRVQYGPVEGDDPDELRAHLQDATGRYRLTLRRQ